MPKRLAHPIVARHFKFFEEDLVFLEQNFGPRTKSGLSLNEIVRRIVHDSVKQARAKLESAAEERATARAKDGVEEEVLP